MNYLLVCLTFLVLAVVFIGVSLLATDRLFPARKAILYAAQDGITLEEDRDMPILLPEGANPADYRAIKIAGEIQGYNRQEVDELLTRLITENERLRAAQRQDTSPSASQS